MGILAASITNDSIIRPPGFYIIGFNYVRYIDLFLIFIAFVYIVTVLSNAFILSIICIDNRLHTPKYIAVGNLAIIDLLFSTTIIPSMIKVFLAKDNFISYNACLTQMFFYYCFFAIESFSLCALAYDRVIAICFPLRQSSINTITVMISILVIVWTFCVSTALFATMIMTRLSFCNSVIIYTYFCDYEPVFRLSCNDNSLQWTTASSISLIVLFGSLGLIVMSYACILTAVFRMKTIESRYRALATCAEHLVLVAIFYVPIMTVFIIELFFELFKLDMDVTVVIMSLATCIPPCLNPIVYSLSTKEIKNRIMYVLQKTKVSAWTRQA